MGQYPVGVFLGVNSHPEAAAKLRRFFAGRALRLRRRGEWRDRDPGAARMRWSPSSPRFDQHEKHGKGPNLEDETSLGTQGGHDNPFDFFRWLEP